MIKGIVNIILFCAVFTVFSCSTAPEKIKFGKDQCAFCKMSIVQKTFGGEIVTEKGRVYKYDDIQCMAQDVIENDIQYADIYLLTLDSPGTLSLIDSTIIFHNENLKSPMSSQLGACVLSKNIPKKSRIVKWSDLPL